MSSSDITALMSALKTVSNPSALKNQLDNQQGPGFRDYMDQSSRDSSNSRMDRLKEDRARESRSEVRRPEERVGKTEARESPKPNRADDNRSDRDVVEKRSSASEKRKDGVSSTSAKDPVDKPKDKDRVTAADDAAVIAEVSADGITDDKPAEVFASISLQASALFDESPSLVQISAKPQFGSLDIMVDEGDITLGLGEATLLGESSDLLSASTSDAGLDGGLAVEGVTLSAASPITTVQNSASAAGAAALASAKAAVGAEVTLSAAKNADSDVALTDLVEAEEGESDPLLEVKSGNKIQTADTGVLSSRALGAKGAEPIKLDVATAAVASKATIEHAQGSSTGLNHSYLTDRGAQVQGRAIMQNPMMAKEWNVEMAEKVAWFAAKNISSAEIRLDPPELGSLHIRININHEQGQAQVNFSSPHQNVRDALDQSASRLREMFESQGLDLVDVDVGSQQHSEADEQAGGAELAGMEDGDVDELESAAMTPLSSSLVDSYA